MKIRPMGLRVDFLVFWLLLFIGSTYVFQGVVAIGGGGMAVVDVGTIAGTGTTGLRQGYRLPQFNKVSRESAMFHDPRGIILISDPKVLQPIRDGGWDSVAGIDPPPPIAMLVLDGANNQVRKVWLSKEKGSDGDSAVFNYAGSPDGQSGYRGGTGSDVRFRGPRGMCWAVYRRGWDPNGVDPAPSNLNNVFIADTDNRIIRKMDLTSETEGTVTLYAGNPNSQGYQNGAGTFAKFHSPWYLTVNSMNVLIAADSFNYVIRAVTDSAGGQGTVSFIAGTPGVPGTTDGLVTMARFQLPYGLAANDKGELFVSSFSPGTTVRKVSGGMVVTILGVDTAPGYNEGVGTATRFNQIKGIVMDGSNKLYIADRGNFCIRRVVERNLTALGLGNGLEYTADLFAGNGSVGWSDGIQGADTESGVMINGPNALGFEEYWRADSAVLYFTSFANYLRYARVLTVFGPTPTQKETVRAVPTASPVPTGSRHPTISQVASATRIISATVSDTLEISESLSGASLSLSLSAEVTKRTYEKTLTSTVYFAPVKTVTQEQTVTEEIRYAPAPASFFETFAGRGVIFLGIFILLVLIVYAVYKARDIRLMRIKLELQRKAKEAEDEQAFGRNNNRFLIDADDEAIELAAQRDSGDRLKLEEEQKKQQQQQQQEEEGSDDDPFAEFEAREEKSKASSAATVESIKRTAVDYNPPVAPRATAPTSVLSPLTRNVAVSGGSVAHQPSPVVGAPAIEPPKPKFYRARNGAMIRIDDDDDL